jgi:hypothetical protein
LPYGGELLDTLPHGCEIVRQRLKLLQLGRKSGGEGEAADEDAGIAKAIAQFNVEPGQRDGLIAVRRGS